MDAKELSAVSEWLSIHLPELQYVVKSEKFTGGQSNPTYRLATTERSFVLRRKPPGALLKSAHAIDREFRVQAALESSAVPVAGMLVFCQDESVIGAPFYIMEDVRGRTFDDPRLPELSPDQRDEIINEMNNVLVAIHEVDIKTANLSDYGPDGDYYSRQLNRWTKQYLASQTEELPDMNTLMDWLRRHLPADDGQRCLVHGDYRLDNLMFAPDGTSCLAVLDWELSTLGHPFADLASVIMQWQLPPGRERRGLAGVDRKALGLWSDQRFIDTYCQRRGLKPIGNFNFYLAFCFFRMAAILQGVKRRALEGNAADPERALELGAHVPEFARLGLEATKGTG